MNIGNRRQTGCPFKVILLFICEISYVNLVFPHELKIVVKKELLQLRSILNYPPDAFVFKTFNLSKILRMNKNVAGFSLKLAT